MGPGRTWPPGLRGVVKAPLRGLRHAGAQGFRGILDQIGPAPVAAWSLSRALSASYAGGPLCDLRRSSDSGTLTILAGDDAEADLGSYAAWAGADTIFCAKVYDQSGGGNHLVQATPASQPKFTPDAGPNGRPAIFDDDTRAATMTLAGGSSIDGMWATGGSAIVALSCSSAGSLSLKSMQIRVMGSEGAQIGKVRPGFYFGWSSAGNGSAFWRTVATGPLDEGAAFVWHVEYSASSTSNAPVCILNGEPTAMTVVRPALGVPEADSGTLSLFSFSTDGMHIWEMIYFRGALSNGESVTLNINFTSRYVT
jgi:hypothetical protein